MLKICLIILIFFQLLTGKTQNAKEDILKINEAYSKFTDLSMSITYNLYANFSATKTSETETGLYKQFGKLRYNKLKNIESIQNKEYLIVIDNEDKKIVIGNPVRFDYKKVTMIDLDSIFKSCSNIKLIDNIPEQKGYKLSFKPDIVSEHDAIELYFNRKTYLVEKLVFYYRRKIRVNENDENSPKEKPRLEIVFSKFNFHPEKDNNLFLEASYFEKNKNKYYPVKKYVEYEIIDQKYLK